MPVTLLQTCSPLVGRSAKIGPLSKGLAASVALAGAACRRCSVHLHDGGQVDRGCRRRCVQHSWLLLCQAEKAGLVLGGRCVHQGTFLQRETSHFSKPSTWLLYVTAHFLDSKVYPCAGKQDQMLMHSKMHSPRSRLHKDPIASYMLPLEILKYQWG